ncbi:HNH endonuclease [Halococcoides cellulosivorans]|uniref:HNH nuclease domain-containing protein n=1 Tax=Halococcoides cellulosivorans TaxID=1679096 RepID=A0A2R4X3U3_9EURY|nr:HNH endonuclease [Halococcoides cellulosivorans]AWB28460.1 hypothetical protein HARCEL1_12490 [Halococcoides cellulosivorans]
MTLSAKDNVKTLLLTLYIRMVENRGQRFKEIARTVRNRDAGRCLHCDEPEREEFLSVHHLVPESDISDEFDPHLPVNLVTLCRECHSKFENQSLPSQLRQLDIEEHSDLMITDAERRALNKRLKQIGTEIRKVKKISKSESRELYEYYVDRNGAQSGLSDFK